MQQARSNFVTPAGLVILAAFSLFSAYIGAGLLFALLAGLFLVCLVSWLWTRNALKKLSLELKQPEVFAYPGEMLYVEIEAQNDKMLPLVWLRAAFPVKEGACAEFAEEDAATFSWVLPHQKLAWTDRYKAVKRGICTVPAAGLSSGDGFGLSDASKAYQLAQPLKLIVFPMHTDVNVNFLLRRLTEFEPSKNGLYTDPTLINSVRDIIPTDSMRDINWRLFAKEGKLQVNVREKLDTKRIAFLIDLESYSVAEKTETNTGVRTVYHVDESLEKTLSVVGSAITGLSEKGVRCSLIIPGYTVKPDADSPQEARPSCVICPGPEDEQEIMLLSALAGIDYQGGPAKIPYSAISEENHSLGQIFLFGTEQGSAQDKVSDAAGIAAWSVVTHGGGTQRCINETELLL